MTAHDAENMPPPESSRESASASTCASRIVLLRTKCSVTKS